MMGRTLLALAATAGVAAAGSVGSAAAQDRFIVVQSTTSTQNSGLYEHILPMFAEKTGIEVRVVAVGTGQAIRNAANGDGDVLLVHARAAEEQFVAEGYGVARFDVMHNDFVVVGPRADPAGVAGMTDAVAALAKIAQAEALFASRGDDSGTHKAELGLWKEAGVDVQAASGGWYRETGSGMGTTLNTGIGMGAYVMTDRATWISFGNKGAHRIVVEGDPKLFNQYGIILVNPERHPNVRAELGRQFVDWVLSGKGQAAIASFTVDGQQLFFPNAARRPRYPLPGDLSPGGRAAPGADRRPAGGARRCDRRPGKPGPARGERIDLSSPDGDIFGSPSPCRNSRAERSTGIAPFARSPVLSPVSRRPYASHASRSPRPCLHDTNAGRYR